MPFAEAFVESHEPNSQIHRQIHNQKPYIHIIFGFGVECVLWGRHRDTHWQHSYNIGIVNFQPCSSFVLAHRQRGYNVRLR